MEIERGRPGRGEGGRREGGREGGREAGRKGDRKIEREGGKGEIEAALREGGKERAGGSSAHLLPGLGTEGWQPLHAAVLDQHQGARGALRFV